MGKRLAIRGHLTRGKEVIELLEMMGGKNVRKLNGEANMYSYYLSDNIITSDRLSIAEDDDFEIFTLQDFLEKFPFKIHDLVNIPEYESTVGICGMRWDPYSKHMEYMVYRCDDEEWYTAEELLDYNDNPNEPSKKEANKPTKVMEKKLAIKGHPTRGKEVIELLEMMGGINSNGAYGNLPNNWDVSYYIFTDGVISVTENKILTKKQFEIFTLEEYLEKFPYKVGDKVYMKVDPNENCLGYDKIYGEIESAMWVEKFGHVVYKLKGYSGIFHLEELHPYKEESMEEKDKAKAPNLKGEDYSGKRYGYKIPDGYEFDTIVNGKIILKPIKPKYPTTYKECEKILGLEDSIIEGCLGYEYKLLNDFQKLLMCRDTYWKIAGEQMGLGKAWKADFTQGSGIKYIILFANGEVIWNRPECETVTGSRVLAFPTAEMRDAFYENFKDLIENCKELL